MPGPEWMHDGMLGTGWFGDRTWEWDYRAGTLRLLHDDALPEVEPAHVVGLGFQADADGKPTTLFPPIPARLDGEALTFLFVTGAPFRLAYAAAAQMGAALVSQRSRSFINGGVHPGCGGRHPDLHATANAAP